MGKYSESFMQDSCMTLCFSYLNLIGHVSVVNNLALRHTKEMAGATSIGLLRLTKEGGKEAVI